MGRRDREEFGDEDLAFVFVAGNVREAERAETALTSAGIDYCLEVEDFTQGILTSTRAGLGFYVSRAQAAPARARLREARLRSGVVEDP